MAKRQATRGSKPDSWHSRLVSSAMYEPGRSHAHVSSAHAARSTTRRRVSGWSGGQDEHHRVGAERDDLEVAVPGELHVVGGRDDHVHLAGAQRGPALVRLRLDQLDVQVRVRRREPRHGGHREGVDRALERPRAARCRSARRSAPAAPPPPRPSGPGSRGPGGPGRRRTGSAAPGARSVRGACCGSRSRARRAAGTRSTGSGAASRRPRGRCRGCRGARAGAAATGSARDHPCTVPSNRHVGIV